MDDWIEHLRKGTTISILAEVDGEPVAYASLHQDQARWTRRVGEIRVNAASCYRGVGRGRALVSEIFEIGNARGLKKLVAMMTPEQTGARHDLLVMAFDIAGFTDQVPTQER